MKNHSERAHSKYSASGAERWFNCPGSVALSEGVIEKSSIWAEEGTRAHEVLERVFQGYLTKNLESLSDVKDMQMLRYATMTAEFILALARKNPDSDVLVETRIYLDFIHPEMFGTFDAGVIDHFGTLHVFDYKYGAGYAVSPKENLQMIFYGIGLAHQFAWNFKRVRLWIIQPRIKGFDGPVFWDVPTMRLKAWVHIFRKAVERVETSPEEFIEGSWCHWCKAKPLCPLKREAKLEAARTVFSKSPIR